MSDEREDREISRPSLADAIDLLDLVRNSEEAARLSTEALAPTPAAPVTEPMLDAPRVSGPPPPPRSIPPPLPPVAEEFVEVGDDAVDAPPSMPPARVSINPRASNAPKPVTLLAAKSVQEPPSNAMPPVVGIILVLGLVIGGLYGITAWGSHDKADPKPEPAVAAPPAAEPKPEPKPEPTIEPKAPPSAMRVASENVPAAPPSITQAAPPRPVVVPKAPPPSASVAPAPTPEPLRPEAPDLKVEGNPQQ